nr:MAG: N-acetylmuramoyl-L-alanine amidase [Bacteriophage sp.]
MVEDGRVACIVDPDDRAWHAGDGVGVRSKGNDMGIGIECNPRQSDGDYRTIAELVRDLRNEYGDLPLIRHRDCSATQCPGSYDLERLDGLARVLESSTSVNPLPVQPSTQSVTRLEVDGSWGPLTMRRAQEVAGTTVDGVMSGQIKCVENQNIACLQVGTSGSDWVEWMSHRFGITDRPRNAGPDFIHRFLLEMNGFPGDGMISPAPSQAVKEFQKRLNDGRIFN